MSGKRERKNPDVRRDEIITAARLLFAHQGFGNTTMQQVVNEAGTSIGNCYFYFPNKVELYRGVVESVNSEISDLVDSAIMQMNTPYEKLAAAVYYGVMSVLELIDSAALILTGTDHPDIRRSIIDHYTKRIFRFLRRNPAITGDLDLEMTSIAWQGGMFNLIERYVKDKSDVKVTEVARFLVRWNLRALNATEETIGEALKIVERKYNEQFR